MLGYFTFPFWLHLEQSEQLSWDTAKLIIQSQNNMALVAITVLVGIAILLMAWNFFISRRSIEETIREKMEEARKGLSLEITSHAEETFNEHSKKIEDQVNKVRQEIEMDVDKRELKLWKTVMTSLGETARVFAVINDQDKQFDTASWWWARAIRHYIHDETQQDLLRRAIDGLKDSLSKCTQIEDECKQEIKEALPLIPKILIQERRIIEKKLKELEKEPIVEKGASPEGKL